MFFSCERKEVERRLTHSSKISLPEESLFILKLQLLSLEPDLEELDLPFAIEVFTAESGQSILKEWVDSKDDIISLPPLERGTYMVRVFIEGQLSPTSGGLPEYTPCPSPFSLRDPLTYLNVDPGVSEWRGLLNRDDLISLQIRRVSCGPGDRSTSISGVIESPVQNPPPLFLYLRPIIDGRGLSSVGPLTFPLHLVRADSSQSLTPELNDERMSPEDEQIKLNESKEEDAEVFSNEEEGKKDTALFSFIVTQIPQGTYDVSIFSDEDQNARPTPCDISLGIGADRWRGEGEVLEIERGEQSNSSRALILQQIDECDLLINVSESEDDLQNRAGAEGGAVNEIGEGLTSQKGGARAPFFGQIDLTPDLLDQLYLSRGKIWISTHNRNLNPRQFIKGVPLFNVQEALLSEGRFTVHLPPEANIDMYPVALWIENGNDQRLIPCDDSSDSGTDVYWWEGTSLDLIPFVLRSSLYREENEGEHPLIFLDNPLSLLKRCQAPEAVVSGHLQLNFNSELYWFTRPLILVLENIFTGEIRQSMIRYLSSDLISERLYFERRIKPGSYTYFSYIDHDDNGEHTPCHPRILGDPFKTTSDGLISIRPGEYVDLGDISLSLSQCEVSTSNMFFTFSGDQLDQIVEGEPCDGDEVVFQLSEINREGDQEKTQHECLPLRDDGKIEIPNLFAGRYRAELCFPIEPSPYPLNTECEVSPYLGTQILFNVNEAPQQEIELLLTPQCFCASPSE